MGSKFLTMVGGGAGGGIKLESIAITKPPENITYLPGEVFDPAGMVVTASYSNGATLTATGWTYSPSGALPEGTSEVEIIYTEAGVTKTTVQAITVERGTISVPTVSGSLTYNGQAQSPTLTGYDADKMVLSGDTSGTNAGSYTAVVTPTAQYKWADGSTEAKDIQWSIAKATPSITFDPTSVSLDTSTTSQVVAVTYTGDGTLSAQSDNSGVATASLEGTTLTVTGVETGNTAIQVSASEGTNYTAVSASLSVAVQFAIIIPVVPSQKGTLTYNGEAQMAEWNDLNTEELTLVGASYRTNAGTYTMGFQPKPGYQWWDGTTETKNATWTIEMDSNTAVFSPHSTPTLNANQRSVTITVTSKYGGEISVRLSNQNDSQYVDISVDNDSAVSDGYSYINISAKKQVPTETGRIHYYVTTKGSTNYAAVNYGKDVKIESLTSVFGVSWDSSNPSTALTRLTKANDPNKLVTVDITTEPVPAVGTGSGSSPFDSYMPWMGMEEYNISNTSGEVLKKKGESGFSRENMSNPVMVKIPEFYYKIEKSGNIFRYYVADGPVDGFHLHPGSECYVARYEAIAANSSSLGNFLTSISDRNTAISTGLTRADFRTRARNMAPGFQLYDFAAWCAVGLLYRVEYADWGSQEKIGPGIVNDTSAHKTGETDAMVYHTGRANSSDNSAVQYRWIENPWGNVSEFIDGINVYRQSVYICTDPEIYTDDTDTNYPYSNIKLPTSGWIKGLGFSSVFPWAFIPNANGGSSISYIPDYTYSGPEWKVLNAGGHITSKQEAGLFFFHAGVTSSGTSNKVGARLQFREVKS